MCSVTSETDATQLLTFSVVHFWSRPKYSLFAHEFSFMNNYQLQNRAVYINPVAYMIFQRNTKEPGWCQTTVEGREENMNTIRIAKEMK